MGSGASLSRPPLRARDDLSSMERYASQQASARYRLNTNESPYAPPPKVIERITEELSGAGLNRYPNREAVPLRDRVAAYNDWPPEGVWVANGSNEVFLHLLLAFGGPGRTAVIFEPTFPLHATIARITGTRALQRGRTEDFLIDLDDAVAALRDERPEIVVACSPNNPSGGCEPLGTIRTLLDEARGIVVVDEAYIEFATREESTRSLLDTHPNLVLVKTLSKAWSLAGVRLGYLLAAPDLVAEMEAVRIPYHLSTIAQVAGVAALDGAGALQESVDVITAERDRITIELQKRGLVTYPSRANFVLFRVEDAPRVWQGLLSHDVLVRNLDEEPGLAGCLRVTAGLPEENDAFLGALDEALDD
ncbi:MAG: histidinol-phosphate transaminase [Actinomycetota bacterium]|nr:histidinol-phosphate transaminase [Actinomycetota bacterium]